MKFDIDNRLWSLDDPRIERLHGGELSLTRFFRDTKRTDPWTCSLLRGAIDSTMAVRVLDEAQIEEQRVQLAARMRSHIARTGGLVGRKIWDNRDAFLTVYPELRPKMEEIGDQIAKEKCKGCALNGRTAPLADALLALSPDGRNFDPLRKLLSKETLARLESGKDLDPADIEVDSPLLHRRIMPARKVPLVGDPRVVLALPGERAIGDVSTAARRPRGNSMKSPRPPCFGCCRKHVAQAIILLGESKQGYPQHRWLAVGHLAEASEEIMGKSETLAADIRAERLVVMDDPAYIPDLMRFFDQLDLLEAEESLRAQQGGQNGQQKV